MRLSGTGRNAEFMRPAGTWRESVVRPLRNRAVAKVGIWSAPAERSGDGAFGHAGRPGASAAARAKAVSRFACHRTPKPETVRQTLSLALAPSAKNH